MGGKEVVVLTVPQYSSIRSGGSFSSISRHPWTVPNIFPRIASRASAPSTSTSPSPSAPAPAENPNDRSSARVARSASAMDSAANMIWEGV